MHPDFFTLNFNSYESDIAGESYGYNATLRCPVRMGVLSQSYSIAWSVDADHSFTENYETSVEPSRYSSIYTLTLFDVQQQNAGFYVCNVTVVNPYDGEVWSRTGEFVLGLTTGGRSSQNTEILYKRQALEASLLRET